MNPFCGVAECVLKPVETPQGVVELLFERVTDCGPPIQSDKCNVTNPENIKEPFPHCCPKVVCEEGFDPAAPVPADSTPAGSDSVQATSDSVSTASESEAVASNSKTSDTSGPERR